MHDAAALYIDPRGPYPRIAGVDCWDEARDARDYTGPYPVVAHPPCGPWGRLRHLSRRPQDAELFANALECVRLFGGVLEHPAGSKAWEAHDLPRPSWNPRVRDEFGGWTYEVEQVKWGHVARKRTWLYLVGVPDSALEDPPYEFAEPTHWASGRRGNQKGGTVPRGIKVCSAQQRRRTPLLFAEYLVRLARAARVR